MAHLPMGADAAGRFARRDYGTTGRALAVTLAGSALVLSLGVATSALAADAGADLAAKKMCMGCHRIDERRNGPSFRDIARRYAGQPEAVAMLSRKVITGGRGAWGMVPMPANPQVSEAEARQIVQWILTQR